MATAPKRRTTTKSTALQNLTPSPVGSAHAAESRCRLAAGLILLCNLVISPLNFGSTRPGGMWLIAILNLVAGVFWLVGYLVSHRTTRTSWPIAASTATVSVVGLIWLSGMVAPTLEDAFTAHHFSRVAARWPNSVIQRPPAETIFFQISLCFAVCVVADLAGLLKWRLAFGAAIVAPAVLAGIIGLIQNATHAHTIYWQAGAGEPGQLFGPFFHHTSAGGYINTAWPMAFALGYWFREKGQTADRAPLWSMGFFMGGGLLLLSHLGHISRFPQLAALVISPILIASLAKNKRQSVSKRGYFIAAIAVAAFALVLQSGTGRLHQISSRWSLFLERKPHSGESTPAIPEARWPQLMRGDLFVASDQGGEFGGDRAEADATAWRAFLARPFFGHGPGNWRGAASHFTSDPFVRTFYLYLVFAHQDLLQDLVEWGLFATIGWWTLLIGGFVSGWRHIKSTKPETKVLVAAAVAGLASLLLQSQIDFPLHIPAIALNVAILAGLCWAKDAVPSHYIQVPSNS